MVCWLVKDEQVHRLKQKLKDGKTGALAARQHLDLLRGVFASKHERAQQVANLVSYLPLCHIVDGLENRKLTIEQRSLVLSKIAYLNIMSKLQLARVLKLSHDTFYQGRFSLAVTTHKRNLVAAFYRQVHAAKDRLVVKRHAHIAHLDRVGAASRTGRELKPKPACVFLINLYKLQLLKHLYAALHLKGLRVGSLETLYKVFRFSNHFLLLLILLHLLLTTLFSKLQILAVRSLIVVNASHGHLDGARCDVVHKLAVVADHHNSL